MELQVLVQRIAAAIREQVEIPHFRPGRVSIWLRFVRAPAEGETPTEQVGPVQKLVESAHSREELIRVVAEQIVLAVYGAEVQVVREIPNLILKLFDQRAVVRVPGAPTADEPGQIYLKVTVYRHQPNLLGRLFGGEPEKGAGD